MLINDREHLQSIALLIAGFMNHTLTIKQTRELDDWIAENDDNMLLFERVTDPEGVVWAQQWFRDLGVEPPAAKCWEHWKRKR